MARRFRYPTAGRTDRRAGYIRRSAGAPPTLDPIVIFGAAAVQLWVRGDLGSPNAGSWPDQSGNGRDFSQGTALNQPTYTANDATLNNLPTFTGDGANSFMTATLDRPAPGSGTETTVISVAKQITWTGGAHLYGPGNQTMAAVQGGASPGIVMRNPTSVLGSNGAPLGSWARLMQQFTGSASDLNKVGSAAAVTGVTAGTTNPGATWTIFGRTAGSGLCNVAYFEYIVLAGVPTALQVGLYDGYIEALTAGVVLT